MRPSIPPHSSAMPASKAVFLLAVMLLFAVMAIVQSGTIQAQTPEPTLPEGSYSESEAQGIDRMIMCPVCPAETIDQAQVQISQQMRQVVREMLSEGKDRDEILDFFVERYGQDILAAPPKTGANLVAWLAPVGGVAAALVAVYLILRSMTRREPVLVASGPTQDPGLIPYLQLVDRHLDLTRSDPGFGGTSDLPDSGVESSGMESTGPDENA